MEELNKQMEQLGYISRCLFSINNKVWGIQYINYEKYQKITFDLIDKQVCISCIEEDEGMFFDMQDLDMINKICVALEFKEGI